MHDGHLRLLRRTDIAEFKSKVGNFVHIDPGVMMAFDSFLGLSERELGVLRVEILNVDMDRCCEKHAHGDGRSIQFAYTLDSRVSPNIVVEMMLDCGFKGIIVGKTGMSRWYCGSMGDRHVLRYSNEDNMSNIVERL